jgi:4-hydroxybenzoate polyprenyltransferase
MDAYVERKRPFVRGYLEAAQAYMLISIPTGTSTIFGIFQAISTILLERNGRLP